MTPSIKQNPDWFLSDRDQKEQVLQVLETRSHGRVIESQGRFEVLRFDFDSIRYEVKLGLAKRKLLLPILNLIKTAAGFRSQTQDEQEKPVKQKVAGEHVIELKVLVCTNLLGAGNEKCGEEQTEISSSLAPRPQLNKKERLKIE